MPFGFLSSIDVKVIAAAASRAIPLGIELLAVEKDIALPACFLCALYLESVDLPIISRGSRHVIDVSDIPEVRL